MSRFKFAVCVFAIFGLVAACGAGSGNQFGDGEGAEDGTGSGGDGGLFENPPPPPCVNLECQQVQCDGGAKTTVTGTVYDPSGQLALYNVMVYVPNAEVQPMVDELTCDQCDAELSGSPLVTAVTDTHGQFVLENVPVGDQIPLVIQVGKWRRIVTIPTVAECVDNPITDPTLTRLPKSRAEGNLPRIALSTGGCDPLFCLLRKLGIDDSEFGAMGSDARIHFYGGPGQTFQAFDAGFGASPGQTFAQAPTQLWSATGWSNYDIVMLSCECGPDPATKTGLRVNLRDYLNAGGRVFATHYHYNWMQGGADGDAPPDLASVGTFTPTNFSLPEYFNNDTVTGVPADIDQSFPKGQALADWMVNVGGSTTPGVFNVKEIRANTITLNPAVAQQWVSWDTSFGQGTPQGATPGPASPPDRTVYFSFNAPIGAAEDAQCGRMVMSDIHVSSGAGSGSGNFPSTCTPGPLTAQEKALIFLLFDLSACIQPDDDPVVPPPQ